MQRCQSPLIRLALSAAALLTCGITATVLVTWAVVMVVYSRREIPVSPLVQPPAWPGWIPASWPPPTQQNRIRAWWGQVDRFLPSNWRDSGCLQVECGAVGVPCRALGWQYLVYAIDDDHSRAEYPWGWRFDPQGSIPISILPFRPLWPDFALNTIFYAAVAWGLWQVPLVMRRRRRRRKGQCVTCGYCRREIAPDARCPECGRVK